MLDQEIQSLIDERKIYRVLARYCMGADRRDPVLMKDCYWPEGMDDHGITPPLNAHEFVDAAVNGAIIKKLKMTQHVLGQVSYEIIGTRAKVESYVMCYQRVINDPETVGLFFGETYRTRHAQADCDTHDILGGGRYLDVFEKRGDEWRILNRVATGEWKFAEPASKVMSEGLFKTAHKADATYLE